MGLFSILSQFGFDPTSKARMARHQDTRFGTDFDALVESDQFEEYQAWQGHRVFDDAEFLVSFIGDGGGRARFWGIYRILGHELVPYEQLPAGVLWQWHKQAPHYRYHLERLPQFDPLAKRLVIEWSSERTWVQHLKDNRLVESPELHDIDLPSWTPLFAEGKAFERLAISRQRSQQAREECLQIHGCRCAVCEMTFPEAYGGLGEGFMHVHHKTAVSAQTGEYQVSPKDDLWPVCPNCHSMLHWGVKDPRTIDELRSLMGK